MTSPSGSLSEGGRIKKGKSDREKFDGGLPTGWPFVVLQKDRCCKKIYGSSPSRNLHPENFTEKEKYGGKRHEDVGKEGVIFCKERTKPQATPRKKTVIKVYSTREKGARGEGEQFNNKEIEMDRSFHSKKGRRMSRGGIGGEGVTGKTRRSLFCRWTLAT